MDSMKLHGTRKSSPRWKDDPTIAKTLAKVKHPMPNVDSTTRSYKVRTYITPALLAKMVLRAREGADIRDVAEEVGCHLTTVRNTYNKLDIGVHNYHCIASTVPETFDDEGYPKNHAYPQGVVVPIVTDKGKSKSTAPVLPVLPSASHDRNLALAILSGQSVDMATLVEAKRQLETLAVTLKRFGLTVSLRDDASGTQVPVLTGEAS